MKKVLILSLLVMILCTGCTKSIELTHEESDLIAEYTAGVMLKYSHQNKWNYAKLQQENSANGGKTSSNTGTGLNTNGNKQGNTQGASQGSTQGANSNTVNNAGTTAGNSTTYPTDDAGTLSSLANSLGLAGTTIKYSHYEVASKYPEGDLVLSVPADSGKKIIAVEFMITNNAASSINVDTASKSVTMKLSVNGEAAIAKSTTLLKNDITGMKNLSIIAGETYTAVALFQVTEGKVTNINSLSVSIADGSKTIGTITVK